MRSGHCREVGQGGHLHGLGKVGAQEPGVTDGHPGDKGSRVPGKRLTGGDEGAVSDTHPGVDAARSLDEGGAASSHGPHRGRRGGEGGVEGARDLEDVAASSVLPPRRAHEGASLGRRPSDAVEDLGDAHAGPPPRDVTGGGRSRVVFEHDARADRPGLTASWICVVALPRHAGNRERAGEAGAQEGDAHARRSRRSPGVPGWVGVSARVCVGCRGRAAQDQECRGEGPGRWAAGCPPGGGPG